MEISVISVYLHPFSQETVTTYVLFPMTLLIFIWTVSCFKLMANTTNVSHGAPCWPAALPFLLNEGVDVLVTESGWEGIKMSKNVAEEKELHLEMGRFFVITSSRGWGIRHAPGATRCGGLEVAQAAWGHVASGGVLRKDVGRLGHVLRPGAAVPGPPIGFPAGLGGQMLSDVFGRVRGGGARGCSQVKVERCK